MDKIELLKTLKQMVLPQFNELIFILGAPKEYMSSPDQPQVERAIELLNWAEAPGGCGLEQIMQTLEEMGIVMGTIQLTPGDEKPDIGELKQHAVKNDTNDNDDTEAYALARIKDHQSGQPFYLGRTYELQAGIRSQIPKGFKGEPVQLPDQQEPIQLEIVVWAENMEIEPAWIQPYLFSRTEETALAEFQLNPTQSGRKQVRVEFLYQRHWLAKIEFEVEVVEAQELVPVS